MKNTLQYLKGAAAGLVAGLAFLAAGAIAADATLVSKDGVILASSAEKVTSGNLQTLQLQRETQVAPSAAEEADELHSEFAEQFARAKTDLESLLSQIEKLSDGTLEDAIAAQDSALSELKGLSEVVRENGRLDQAMRKAIAFAKVNEAFAAENPSFTEAQRAKLLELWDIETKGLTEKFVAIEEMRGSLDNLLASARSNREFLGALQMIKDAERINTAFGSLVETLQDVIKTLSELDASPAV